MLRSLLKIFRRQPTSTPAMGEWVAVFIPLSEGQFGSRIEQVEIRRMGHKISGILEDFNLGTYDGDEYGDFRGGLFMYGPSADAIFDALESTLRVWPMLCGGCVIKRYGSPDMGEQINF